MFSQHNNIRKLMCYRNMCETIRPGTKEGTLQKGQEPNPTDHRSEGP